MSTTPVLSVVVATRNREERLAFLFDALAEQTIGSDVFELVVVRASDMEGPYTAMPAGIDATFLRCDPGPAAQRNLGWRAARGELIVFTDDDCRPSPQWLAAYLDAYQGDGAKRSIMQGRTAPDPDELELLHGRARSIDIDAADQWFPTCNIAFPRRLLEEIGGFDESFPTAWCEDADLGLRAVAVGASLRFLPAALTYHAVHSRTLRLALREALRRDSLPHLLARHPAQRRFLFLGLFARRTHARFTLALLGLLLARRSRLLGALLVVPYLANRRPLAAVPAELPKIAYHLPSRALVDAVEVWAVARAGARRGVAVL